MAAIKSRLSTKATIMVACGEPRPGIHGCPIWPWQKATWSRMVPKQPQAGGVARISSFSSSIFAYSVLFADGTADCSDARNPYQAVGWKTLTVFHSKPAAPPASSEEPGQTTKHVRVEGCGFGQGPGINFNRGKASYKQFITSWASSPVRLSVMTGI